MSNKKQETLADIVSEMRRAKERCNGATALFSAWLDEWTARIEAAWKRDAAIHAMTVEANGRLREHLEIAIENNKCTAIGNAAAMREACQKMRDLLMLRGDGKVRCVLTWDEFNESQKMLRAALSAPPRNCDVGTAEEQRVRFEAWCEKQPERYCKACAECPTQRYAINCFCKWAQMPYNEEGGDK